MSPPPRPATRLFLATLGGHADTLRAFQGDTLYHVQVEVICGVLDVVDEQTDAATASRIAETIAARYAEAPAAEAVARIAAAGYQGCRGF